MNKGRIAAIALVASAAALASAASAVAIAGAGSQPPSETSELRITPAQQRWISDGVLEYSEYRSAIEEAIECARSKDVDVTGPSIGADGLIFEYAVIADSPDNLTRSSDAFDECYEQFADVIDLKYQTATLVQDVVNERKRVVARCVSDGAAGNGAHDDHRAVETALMAAARSKLEGCADSAGPVQRPAVQVDR
jgi:hypothetical protein